MLLHVTHKSVQHRNNIKIITKTKILLHTLVAQTPWNCPWQTKNKPKNGTIQKKSPKPKQEHTLALSNLGMSSPTSTWHFLDSYDATVYFNLTVLHGVKVTEKIYLHTLLIKQTNRQTLLLIKFIVVWSQPLVGCHSFRQECWQTVKSN